jgi:general secretion pathway protein H
MAAPTMPVTSSAGDRTRGDRGFALYELILALAILAMVAALVVPRLTRTPGPVEIRVAAEEIAALFRSDRNMALRLRRSVLSQVDVEDGVVRAGAGDEFVRIPRGVKIEFVQSSRVLANAGSGIEFRPDGRSSGGALTLSRESFSYRISVNWLTAGVRVARTGTSG